MLGGFEMVYEVVSSPIQGITFDPRSMKKQARLLNRNSRKLGTLWW